MTDGAPQIPASEFVIPFVPDTKPVDEFLDRVEERVNRIAERMAGLEAPTEEGAPPLADRMDPPAEEPRRHPLSDRMETDAMPASAPKADVVAEIPRHEGLGRGIGGGEERAIEENTAAIRELRDDIEELRDDIESLTSAIAALVETLGGG